MTRERQVFSGALKDGFPKCDRALRGPSQFFRSRPSAAVFKWPRALVGGPKTVFWGFVKACVACCIVITAVAVAMSVASAGAANADGRKNFDRLNFLQADSVYLSQKPGRSNSYLDNLRPEDRSRIQRKYREWQSLPPEQRDVMRQRMDDLRRMPPQDRERYQQRYQQWQQLSPEDRRRIENNLQRWNELSPQEREAIRQQFKK